MSAKEQAAEAAAKLLSACRVAALGSSDDGAPRVSMAPFAVRAEPLALVVLISGLSAHTRDLARDPRASVMVMQPERDGEPVHTLARLSIQADARALPPDDPGYAGARAAYERRFPDMRALFDLGDFALFELRPQALRYVGGFAQAHSITPEAVSRALGAGPQ